MLQLFLDRINRSFDISLIERIPQKKLSENNLQNLLPIDRLQNLSIGLNNQPNSHDHRKGSGSIWKEKFIQSQSLIKELNENKFELRRDTRIAKTIESKM